MKKGIACFLACFTLTLVFDFPCLSQQDARQQSPTPEQVLDRFVQAVGGGTAHDSIKTSFSKGSIVDWGGERRSVEKYFKSPDKVLIIEHTPTMEIRRGYDGKIRWVQEGKHKPKRVKPSYDDENDVSFGDMVHWNNRFKKIHFRGVTDVLNQRAYVLAVIGRSPATLYFDQQTGLLLRKDTTWERRATLTHYSKYVEIGGTKMPWHIESIYVDTGKKYVVDLTEAKTNITLDDAIFAMPMP